MHITDKKGGDKDQAQYQRSAADDVTKRDDKKKSACVASLHNGRDKRRTLIAHMKIICEDVENGMVVIQISNTESRSLDYFVSP